MTIHKRTLERPVKGPGDADAFVAELLTPPESAPLAARLRNYTIATAPPHDQPHDKDVAYRYYWGDWSGISFWW